MRIPPIAADATRLFSSKYLIISSKEIKLPMAHDFHRYHRKGKCQKSGIQTRFSVGRFLITEMNRFNICAVMC